MIEASEYLSFRSLLCSFLLRPFGFLLGLDVFLAYAEPETFVLYREVMLAKGASITQLKPVTIIGNEFQRKYFFSLTDTFEEIKNASED